MQHAKSSMLSEIFTKSCGMNLERVKKFLWLRKKFNEKSGIENNERRRERERESTCKGREKSIGGRKIWGGVRTER